MTYGAPAAVPTMTYGAPATMTHAPVYAAPQPIVHAGSAFNMIDHGASTAMPTMTYGAPAAVPTMTYGAPAALPTMTHGAPVHYAAPVQTFSSTAPVATTGSISYTAPHPTVHAAPTIVTAAPVYAFGH